MQGFSLIRQLLSPLCDLLTLWIDCKARSSVLTLNMLSLFFGKLIFLITCRYLVCRSDVIIKKVFWSVIWVINYIIFYFSGPLIEAFLVTNPPSGHVRGSWRALSDNCIKRKQSRVLDVENFQTEGKMTNIKQIILNNG